MTEQQPKSVAAKPAQSPTSAPVARRLHPFEEMERLFDDFFAPNWLRPGNRRWPFSSEAAEGRMPAVDVVDRDSEIVVTAEVPGVKKDNLEVSVTDSSVSIRGKSHSESQLGEGEYVRREISTGSFARTVSLPGEVDVDAAKAEFADGVLTLTLPKAERAKRRTISVG
ncbi:MAG: Hsp20/alpha crystallin family protein [Pseudomonadota bacterium]|nr:Hsp20/alpha crystallin family protein [Pseudomonadota bacterium]